MNTLNPPKTTTYRHRLLAVAISGMLLVPGVPLAEQDPYLQALEGEVEKVEPNEIGEDAAFVSTPESRQEAAMVRERFETMLQQRYAGTYSFYARLPERSRQAIVAEYRQGADIRQLRQMIIDLFYGAK
jgi:hypothetical protein